MQTRKASSRRHSALKNTVLGCWSLRCRGVGLFKLRHLANVSNMLYSCLREGGKREKASAAAARKGGVFFFMKRRVFNGEIMESSMLTRTISIPVTRSLHVQSIRTISYPQSSWKPTSNGLSIVSILILDHKVDKDPRIYCSYCDMNNHPRFTCKHVRKHRLPFEKHHCTLCAAKHPPFPCPRAQINGDPGQPNWYKAEYKRAKQARESRCNFIDGDQWSHMSMSMVQILLPSIHRKHHNQYVQQQQQ